MLSNQTAAGLVQLLSALSQDAVRLLLIKHLNADPSPFTTTTLLYIVRSAPSDGMAGLLAELLGGGTAVRSDAPVKYVFDGRLRDFRARLRADGFDVLEDALIRLVPGAEPTARISDELENALATGVVDADGAIRRLLRESYGSLSATPPDFNDATTKARIALESIARRAAAAIAARSAQPAPADTWGSALHYLRVGGLMSREEEEALAKVYTLISPGAHVPKGLTDEQWALLARTFAVSGAYFLVRQFLAAV